MLSYPPAGSELHVQIGSYLLRSDRHHSALRCSLLRTAHLRRPARRISADAPRGLRMAATPTSVSSTSFTIPTLSHHRRYHKGT